MKTKQLNKSMVKRLQKFLGGERLIDKFEDLIEDTWLDKTYYYCYRKFKWGWWNPRTAWYKIKYGVGNLIQWFPLIWNDRDWDYIYWIEMNIKKLKRMENLIRNKGIHLYNVRDADNIHLAILALKRIHEDNYHDNAFKIHNKKYGKLRTEMVPCNDGTGCSKMIFHRDKAITKKDQECERKASRRLIKHSQYMQKQDLEYATKIINKYLFTWWD